jgi:L-alanine-DL-glutamate epimerase-like enolase superfamily enzyme
VGFGPHLLHDAHHRLTPIEAARLGKELEPFSLFWLEDATPADNYRFEDGYLVMDEVPGLGVDIDEALAAKYPYERAYLPVARLADGSMWHW